MIGEMVELFKAKVHDDPVRRVRSYPRKLRMHFDILNSLVGLRHLELQTVWVVGEEVLSLPNLKVCFVGRIDAGRFTLEAPKLKFFGTSSSLTHINICHPEVIEQLQIAHEEKGLERFWRLKVLKFDNLKLSWLVNVFQWFPLLEELVLTYPKVQIWQWEYQQTCRDMNRLIKQLVDYRSVKIYFFDNLLDNREFEEYEFDLIYPDVFRYRLLYDRSFDDYPFENYSYIATYGHDYHDYRNGFSYQDYLSNGLSDVNLFKSGRLKKRSKANKHLEDI